MYGQNVWRRGRMRNTERKKWRAGLQRMGFSLDHLSLCTSGLTGFSVESWRLKPAAHSPRNRGFCCPKMTGSQLFQTLYKYFNLLLGEGGENLK